MVPSSTCLAWVFTGHRTLSVTQSTVSKHWTKLKALAKTKGCNIPYRSVSQGLISLP